MQGVFINGRRPKSKKEIIEAFKEGQRVSLEATSVFGDEKEGPLTELPEGTYTFVGPDPYTKRNFYGNVIVKGGKVVIK